MGTRTPRAVSETVDIRRHSRNAAPGKHCDSTFARLPTTLSGHAWKSSAAYLYVLRLDALSLAWEYLRRNPQYQQDWACRHCGDDAAAADWQLAAFEDPVLDARVAWPLWRPQSNDVVRLVKDRTARDDTAHFSIWSIAASRTLWHDGCCLVLGVALASTTLRIALPNDLGDGEAHAYVIRVDTHAAQRWRRIQRVDALLRDNGSRNRCAAAWPADRVAIAHLRTLQALDGAFAGASQREIARVLFGGSRVDAGFHADGELRAQTRYLIRRGQRLMHGGYADLVTGVAHKATRITVPKSAGGR